MLVNLPSLTPSFPNNHCYAFLTYTAVCVFSFSVDVRALGACWSQINKWPQ